MEQFRVAVNVAEFSGGANGGGAWKLMLVSAGGGEANAAPERRAGEGSYED